MGILLRKRVWRWHLTWAIILLAGLSMPILGQDLLDQKVSVSARSVPVQRVLNSIAEQAKISFSYSSELFRQDSLVTLTMDRVPVMKALTAIFGDRYQYKQIGNFVVIRPARKEKFFSVDGRVVDLDSGVAVDYASVYTRSNFSSAITDESGNFKLRFRASSLPIELIISKVGYADTTLMVDSDLPARIVLKLRQQAVNLDTLVVRYSPDSRFWLARLFVSSRLRAHSRNISQFFTSAPFQIGITPGLSTHGKLASKVESKVSVNIYGGYNGGVDGVELGGIFNISKADVRYFQAATTFNLVYGDFQGVQVGGLFNQVAKQVSGVQLTTLVNYAGESLNGAQLSVFGNVARARMRGIQAAGFFNYSKNLYGLQLGLINVSRNSSGLSLGIINVATRENGSLSLTASDLTPTMIVWKSGNPKLYNVTRAGLASSHNSRYVSVGIGLGKDLILTSKLVIENQLSVDKMIRLNGLKVPLIYRLQVGPKLRLTQNLALSGGPALSAGQRKNEGLESIASRGLLQINPNKPLRAWLGWYASVHWAYTVRRPF